MEMRKESNHFVIRLTRGEKLFESMQSFFEQTGVKGGRVQGIGAVDEITLGRYVLETKGYVWGTWQGEFEVVSLQGTISETGLHAHAVISDHSFQCFGGHVKEARVSATLELFVTELKKIRREMDSEVGLKLLEL
ncbi:DUF296 domain-containing protein [Candidatus Micrarchaeota archaeon]|nr:DUF296 domain-containing protein [Candidatus Micrarchaeota archaeon]